MHHRLLRRRFVLAALGLVLAFGLVAGLLSSEAEAAPPQEVEHLYFSDASYSQVIGIWLRTCSGGVFSAGPRTAYRITTTSPCF